MQERILVPLDGSRVSESVLPYVEDLVSKLSPGTKVEVTLLQVLSSYLPAYVAGEAVAHVQYTTEEIEESKEKAINYLSRTGERLRSKGATVSATVAFGDASEEIVKVAEEVGADVIAMSTHGRSGISRWALGSVAERVLRGGGKTPILIVRAKE